MKYSSFCIGLALTLLGTSAAIADPVIYSQAATYDVGFSSQNDNVNGNGDFAKVYDNFTLASTKSVTDFHWTGVFFNGAPALITSFLIQIWGDNAGTPGATALSTTTISGASANQTAAGNFGGNPYFTYDADLAAAFTADAATTYWISVQAMLGFPPQWGWAAGTGGDGSSYQVFFGNGSRNARDMAFSLSGVDLNKVPEPGSLALVGLALFGLAGTQRKRAPFTGV